MPRPPECHRRWYAVNLICFFVLSLGLSATEERTRLQIFQINEA
jgi:hypothetical protein